jgi:hypothetical protein
MNLNRRLKRHQLARIALPTLLTATALPGWAQGNPAASLPLADARASGMDVRTACPAFEADMLKALARVAMLQRQPGLLDVSFAVDGRRIGDVAVVGGPLDYRSATRRAVRSLDCSSRGAGPQTVRLQVVFKDL